MARFGTLCCFLAAVLATAMSPAWFATGLASARSDPCGVSGTPPAIQHVIIVMLENHSYNQVVGNSAAPYENELATDCGNATQSYGATHSSAANYLAISAGQYPADSPKGCGYAACANSEPNIYQQLDTAGLTWKAYEESMPSACDTSDASLYKIGHNPPIFYTGITAAECQSNDVGVPDLTAASGAFWDDLQAGTLPAVSWISPDTNDSGENSCGGSCALSDADTWLENFMANVTASGEYQAGNTLVLVTYDEGAGKDYAIGEDCTNETADLAGSQPSCQVPLFAVYPYTQGGSDSTFFDHYSITKTVEDIFGLPYLAHAGDGQTNSLAGHFGIPAATNPPPTACPATPPGATELSGNLSVETGKTGWQGTYNSNSAVTRVEPAGGSYDGLWALRIAAKSGSGKAGVNNARPTWIPGPPGLATTAAQKYTGSAFVEANTPGEQASLQIREMTPAGVTAGQHTSTVTLADTGWHQVKSAYTAKYSGDSIRYSLYVPNLAAASQKLLADCLSLQAP
jgi:phospholipase C